MPSLRRASPVCTIGGEEISRPIVERVQTSVTSGERRALSIPPIDVKFTYLDVYERAREWSHDGRDSSVDITHLDPN